MITITSTNQLPYGPCFMFRVADEAEAAKIADGRTSYLYQSKVITALYLFLPVEAA